MFLCAAVAAFKFRAAKVHGQSVRVHSHITALDSKALQARQN